ncbi:bifunctional glutamate N-acetyltransferase/amino-acid acetyltransferase ArgJ [Calycomorphotria hydatis]|uniref:Arginine biosynthesis bifunctional protein ArgJ n=1 Tax=Calycomorphotria hydatis TaxID=2528027 RepID=A0A517TD01_9PLAN|nr:bifunctional glutamate N-acetyltransferase/amino-acid acetyltransferase ArgJ [Calycomorphotria hydatis]QDT66242.1 Arginine biosynthesis bifunctional protein ArgJ [Calycomorphotria hydatis]
MPHTLPQAFQFTGLHCGVKSDAAKPDLSLFVSTSPATAAGVFTKNLVVGAPVTVSRERVPGASARAVVINSGNANACTGEQGLADARRMTELVAEGLNCAAEDVLVCSTGIIGHLLPMEKIEAGIQSAVPTLSSDESQYELAARGMMTTDTFPKMASRTVYVEGQDVVVSGVAKGAAMIAPNMATMLAVIMTDAIIPDEIATQVLQAAVNNSFNCISVDGHTSTSDTVLLLANGESGVSIDDEIVAAIHEVCYELSEMIIRDAEGAEHFVSVEVTGLDRQEDAHKIAKTVAESALVKTAIAGNDPNWGRIVSAAGYANVPFDPMQVTLKLNDVLLYEQGVPTDYDEPALSESMKSNRDVVIELSCGEGLAFAHFLTSDLTQEYVRLNSEYTT